MVERNISRPAFTFETLSRDQKHLLFEILRQERAERTVLIDTVSWGRSKVNQLIKSLITSKWIVSTPQDPRGNGRPPLHFMPNPDIGYFIGLELNVSMDRMVITDFLANSVHQEHFVNIPSNIDPLTTIVQRVRAFWDRTVGAEAHPLAIGLSAAVQFIEIDGEYRRSPIFTNQTAERFRMILEKEMMCPVYIERPQILLTYRQFRTSLIAQKRSFVNAYIAHNVGLGTFIRGKSYGGASGLSGDLGHLKVEGNTRQCYCGAQGCFRTLVSYQGVQQTIHETLEKIPQGQIGFDPSPFYTRESFTAVELLVKLAKEGNPLGVNLVHSLGSVIGKTLASIVSVLNPECLVVQSAYVSAGDIFTEPLKLVIKRDCLTPYTRDLQYEFAPVGIYDVAEGCAGYALEMTAQMLLQDQSN